MTPSRPTPRLQRAAVPAMTIAAMLFAAGCDDTTRSENAPDMDNPLHFDPTDVYELSEWWTNGEQLLWLHPNFSYDLYADANRYKEPLERGQWSQKTYAALQFEPYSLLNAHVERVVVDKASNGDIVLVIRNLKPFASLAAPPEVMEDQLIGQWADDEFSIDLLANGRYRFERVRTLEPGTSGVAGHEGSWELVDDSLLLSPDPVGLEPILRRVELHENAIVPQGMTRR